MYNETKVNVTDKRVCQE